MSTLEAKSIAEDQAALKDYQASTAQLYKVIREKINTPAEPIFLTQYAESLNKLAQIQFRLIHAGGNDSTKAQADYQSILGSIVTVETMLLTKFPHLPGTPRTYYLRARALNEQKIKDRALADLKYLLDKYPQNDDAIPAQFLLYDLCLEKKDYATAIHYFKPLAETTTSPYSSLILDKLAFAYYYSGNIPMALSYSEKELFALTPASHASDQTSGPQGDATKITAKDIERNKVLKNNALFYFTGLTTLPAQFHLQGFIPYLLKLNPGEDLGNLLKYVLNLFRSKGMDNEIAILKNDVYNRNLNLEFVSDFALNCLEREVSAKNYKSLSQTLKMMDRSLGPTIPQTENPHLEKYEKALGSASFQIQTAYEKAPLQARSDETEQILIEIYTLLLKFPTFRANEMRQKVHFNLAEIYNHRKNYELATQYYSRVLAEENNHPQPGKPVTPSVFSVQARTKRIGSRYELLAQKQTFPKDILPKKGEPVAEPISPEVSEWMGWSESNWKDHPSEESEVFFFETIRTLYAKGHITDAFQKINQLIDKSPKSKFSLAGASLILDTWITNEKWQEASDTSESLVKKLSQAPADFQAKLQKTAADSFFKIAELSYQKGQYQDAIHRGEAFLKKFPTNPRKSEALVLIGNGWLAQGDRKKALEYLTPSLGEKVATKNTATALLLKATLAEETFDLVGAVENYLKFVSLPMALRGQTIAESENLNSKVLQLAWLSGNPEKQKQVLASSLLCKNKNAEFCEKMEVFKELPLGKTSPATFKLWKKSVGASRLIREIASLREPEKLNLEERLLALDDIVDQWPKSESILQYNLIPYVSESIFKSLNRTVWEVRKTTPLELNPSKLAKRTQGIQKTEHFLEKIVALNWQKLRVSALNDWSNLYSNFTTDLLALPKPAGLDAEGLKAFQNTLAELSGPFEKKKTELHAKALETVSEQAVDLEEVLPLKPLANQTLKLEALLTSLKKVGADLAWTNSFLESAKGKNLLKISYLLESAKEKKLLKPGVEALATGISLILAGAQAEGLNVIKDGTSQLPASSLPGTYLSLALSYYQVGNVKKTNEHLSQFLAVCTKEDLGKWLAPRDASQLQSIASFSKTPVNSELQDQLSKISKGII